MLGHISAKRFRFQDEPQKILIQFPYHLPTSVLCDLAEVNQTQAIQNVIHLLPIGFKESQAFKHLGGSGLELRASVSPCDFLPSSTDWILVLRQLFSSASSFTESSVLLTQIWAIK